MMLSSITGNQQPNWIIRVCAITVASWALNNSPLEPTDAIAYSSEITNAKDIDEFIVVNGAWAEFKELNRKWIEERGTSSSLSWITSRPSYLRIIALSENALPYILDELREQPEHWFTALRAITGENPVPQEHRGNMRAMAQDWVDWGIVKGHISA